MSFDAFKRVTAPLRTLTRALVAPTKRERAREADKPLGTREERAEAGRAHANAHIRDRDARRERQAVEREGTSR